MQPEPSKGGLPAGGPYLKYQPDFQRLFPGVSPVPLVASVLFYTPMVRDLVSWCGVRQVVPRTRGPALRSSGA